MLVKKCPDFSCRLVKISEVGEQVVLVCRWGLIRVLA